MIKNIMKNIGPKPVQVEEKEEVREDILPSKISTDDFSYKQLEDYASGLEEALKTQKDKFTDETRASTEKELEAVKKVLLKRQAEKKPEMLNKSWSQEDVIKELPKGWKRVEGATTAPNGYVVVSNNKSRYDGGRETKLIKQEDYRPMRHAMQEDLEFIVEQYKKHPPTHEIARTQRDQAVAELAAREKEIPSTDGKRPL